jgi:hypothetical protein
MYTTLIIGSAGVFTTAATFHDDVPAGFRPVAVDRSLKIDDDAPVALKVDVTISCDATGVRVGGLSRMSTNAPAEVTMTGLMLGLASGIVINQYRKLPRVLFIDGTRMRRLRGRIQGFRDSNAATLAVGAGSRGVLPLRSLAPKLPHTPIMVVLVIIAVKTVDLINHGVAVTDTVPTGLFSFGLTVDSTVLGS